MSRARLHPGAIAFCILGLLVVSVMPTASAAAEGDAAPSERVLVLSVPNLLWEDIDPDRMPELWALLEASAVANLSLKVHRRASPASDAYATIGAGTRAVAADNHAGLVLQPHEPYGLGTAAQEFERRTGTPLEGTAALLTLPDLTRQNASANYGGQLGLVGATLLDAGFTAAVVANADRADTAGASWHREAALALMDTNGILASGRIDRSLLMLDPLAPGGARLDADAVVAAFEDAWASNAVVLVEASDLRRVHSHTGAFTSARRDAEAQRTLSMTDEMIGRLLANVDIERDAVLVVGAANPGSEPRLTVAALRAPGVEPERLFSGQTRRPGYVTITDVGPTILDLVGLNPPATMEGRPFVAGGGVQPLAARIDGLQVDEAEARFRDRLVRPVTNAIIAANILLLFAAAVSSWRGGTRLGLLRFASLALLAVLPMTYLAGFIAFAPLGTTLYVAFLVTGALTVAAAASIVWRNEPIPSLFFVLSLIIGVICTSVVLLDSELQFNTVLGDSPIVAGRFGGVNNVTFAQLLAAGILMATLLAHRPGGRRGQLIGVGLLIAVLLVDVMPFWGSDVGGILAGVPAIALTAAVLLGVRLHVRTLTIAALATGATVGALTWMDLTRPPAQRSHLGRLFERIDHDGGEAITLVVQRKLDQSLASLTGTLWLLLVIATLALVLYLTIATAGARHNAVARVPSLRAAGWGLLATGLLGMALNDSGIAVLGMMLAVTNPALIVLLAGVGWPVPAEGASWVTWWRDRPTLALAGGPSAYQPMNDTADSDPST